METIKSSQEKWVTWLTEERHISIDVAADAGLIGGRELAIPIYDEDYKVLFYKYRRAPGSDEGPKYRYETGSTASLYGIERLQELVFGEILIIAEGELDVLALRTLGYKAVSTTGGSGTWRKEWGDKIRLHTNNIVIAYDADRAGVYGALKVAGMMTGTRIAWLPVQYGKDHTEIIHNGEEDSLHDCFHQARHYDIPMLADETRLNRLLNLREVFRKEREEKLRNPILTPFHIDFAIEWLENEIEKAEEDARPVRSRPSDSNDKIERAKSYPIEKIVKVNRDGFASCVYHEEKSASMKVYKSDNHAFSFCCSKRSDALDVYQAVNNCDFKTALDALQS